MPFRPYISFMENHISEALLRGLINILPIPALHYDLISRKYLENHHCQSAFGKNTLNQLYYNLEQSDFGGWIEQKNYYRGPLIAAKIRLESNLFLYHAEMLTESEMLIIFPESQQPRQLKIDCGPFLTIPNCFSTEHFLISSQNSVPELAVPHYKNAFFDGERACYMSAIEEGELAALVNMLKAAHQLSTDDFNRFFQLLQHFRNTLSFESYFGDLTFAFFFLEKEKLQVWSNQLDIFKINASGIVHTVEENFLGDMPLEAFESCWACKQSELFQSRLPFRNQEKFYLTADHLLHEIKKSDTISPFFLSGLQRLEKNTFSQKPLIRQVFPDKESIHQGAKELASYLLQDDSFKPLAEAAEIVFGEICSNIFSHGFREKDALPFLLIAEPPEMAVLNIFDYGVAFNFPEYMSMQNDPPDSIMDVPERGRGLNIIRQLCTKIERKRCFQLNVSSFYLKNKNLTII